MRKLVIAFFTTPFATLVTLWLTQYLSPVMQMGSRTERVGKWTMGTRGPLELLVFILPSRVSIGYGLATYAVMLLGLPVLYALHRMRRTDLASVVIAGWALGLLVPAVFFGLYAVSPARVLMRDPSTWQVFGCCALLGMSSALWFWWLGIHGNPRFGEGQGQAALPATSDVGPAR